MATIECKIFSSNAYIPKRAYQATIYNLTIEQNFDKTRN